MARKTYTTEQIIGILREVEVRLTQARRLIDAWRTDYNYERPHTSLKGLTSNEFAARSNKDHNHTRLYL